MRTMGGDRERVDKGPGWGKPRTPVICDVTQPWQRLTRITARAENATATHAQQTAMHYMTRSLPKNNPRLS
jgi:hypothetical protein